MSSPLFKRKILVASLGTLLLVPLLPVSAHLRRYGPLTLDFGRTQNMNGSIVIQAKNKKDQDLFIGVNCPSRKFNFTGVDNSWKSWDDPNNTLESRIISDVCNQI